MILNTDIVNTIKEIHNITHREDSYNNASIELSFNTIQDILSLESEIICLLSNIAIEPYKVDNNLELEDKINRLKFLINNLYLEFY